MADSPLKIPFWRSKIAIFSRLRRAFPLINPHFRTSKSPKFSACGGLSLAKETLNGPKSAAGEKKIGISRVYTGGNASKTAPIPPPPLGPQEGPDPDLAQIWVSRNPAPENKGGGSWEGGGGFSAIYLLIGTTSRSQF